LVEYRYGQTRKVNRQAISPRKITTTRQCSRQSMPFLVGWISTDQSANERAGAY
jgi:hypothetical protein